MSKKQIAFTVISIVVLISAGIIFLKTTADKARKKSEQILNDFKTIDKDLKSTDESIKQQNKALDSLLRIKAETINKHTQ